MKALLDKLNDLKANWDSNPANTHGLDCVWICVKFPKSFPWREAKEFGAKKDSYWGWILWSTSINECGGNFSVELLKLAQPFGLLTRTRDL